MMAIMCMMCEGASRAEVRAHIRSAIAGHGWAIQGVEATPPAPGWLYTIGLAPLGHAELVVVGSDDRLALVLDQLGERIRAGERFEAGDCTRVCGADVGFLDVHAAHIAGGLLDGWFDYYRAGMRSGPVRALQVVVPDDGRCHVHQRSQPLLDSPRVVFSGGFKSNRAARRRAQRSHRRPPRRS